MTKKDLLEWIQQEQERLAKLKDNNIDYDAEELLYKLEKMIKELN